MVEELDLTGPIELIIQLGGNETLVGFAILHGLLSNLGPKTSRRARITFFRARWTLVFT